MAAPRQTSPRHSKRRERKHVLSGTIVTPRILFYSLLKNSKRFFIYGSVTVVLVLLLWVAFKGGRYLFIEGDRFSLTEISLTPEPKPNSLVNYVTLPQLTGLESGVSIFSYDLDKLAERLKSRPEIKDAFLTRRLPGTIIVAVEERIPIAKMMIKNKLQFVDKKAYCFRSDLIPPKFAKQLPMLIPMQEASKSKHIKSHHVVEIGLQRAIHFVSVWNDYNIEEKLLSVEVKNYHSIEAMTETGTKLIFGYYEHERQVQDYCSLQAYCNKSNKTLSSANLLPYKNIPVVFNQGPKSNLRLQKEFPTSSQINSSPSRSQGDILLILEQG